MRMGKLRLVLRKHVGAASSFSLVFHERELMAPAVRALIDFIVEWNPTAALTAGRNTLTPERAAR
jgi:hypothetical protein